MDIIDLFLNGYNYAVIIIGGLVSLWFGFEYKKTKTRALLNSLPGVFTSLGLLCTFISICASLYDISDKVNLEIDNTGKTIKEVAASGGQNFEITEIISELIPAFTSSIVGLICALVATIIAKYIFAKEEAEENERMLDRTPEQYIQDIAENSVTLKSIDSLLGQHNEHLAKLITIQETQEKKYSEYNENLNSNIQHQNEILKEFIDGFVNRMDSIFKQMNSAIDQQVKAFGEKQFSKTSELLSTITNNLSKISTDLIKQQKTSVETMMSKTNEGINGISTSVTTVLGNLTKSIQKALEGLGTNQQNQLTEISSSIAKNLEMLSGQMTASLSTLGTEQGERLNSIITNYDSLAKKLSEQNSTFAEKVNTKMSEEFAKVQQHNTESLKQMTALNDSYKALTSEMLTSALSMNETATNNIRESIGGFVSNMQSTLSSQCTTLSKAINDNVESLNKAYSFIESLVAEIKQNYDQAVLAYGDAVDVAHRTNESSEKAIAATNKSLASVEETNEMIGSVLEILTERQENLENLTKQIGSISTTIESLQKLESTLNKLVNK